MNTNMVVAVVVAVTLPLVFRFLSSRSSAPIEPGTLRYSTTARVLSAILTLALPTMVVVVLLLSNKPLATGDVKWVLLIIGMGLTLGSPLLLETVRVRLDFDDRALRIATPWSRNRSIAWGDVVEVRWVSWAKWLDFRGADGSVIHVSPLLSGLAAFGAHARAQVSANAKVSPASDAVMRLFIAGRAGELLMSPLKPEQLANQNLRR